MSKILIVEDDKEISNMLQDFLSKNQYETSCALNGLDGMKLAVEKEWDLIILDLMIPYKSGDELLRELRAVSDVPVLVVSAKSLIQTKVELLRLGADDYMTKPFDLNELLARIEANIKRYQKSSACGTEAQLIQHGALSLNQSTKEIHANDVLLTLTAKEYHLLALMLLNPQKVFSKQNLYESVWNETYAYDDNTINTHISNLRKKIKEAVGTEVIETVWGMGYKLSKV